MHAVFLTYFKKLYCKLTKELKYYCFEICRKLYKAISYMHVCNLLFKRTSPLGINTSKRTTTISNDTDSPMSIPNT